MREIKTVCFIRLKEPLRADPYSDPPLGILSVMASAKKFCSWGEHLNLRLLDMAHETEIPEADVYALSACTPDYPTLLEVAKQIKEKYGAPIIAGGPHFDVLPASQWEKEIENADFPIDIVCRGEGEYTFPKAIEFLEIGGKKKVITQEGAPLNLNTLLPPAREFLKKELYFKPGKTFGGNTFSSGNSTTMMTSRGCPFNCAFCASPAIYCRKVRYRSVENVRKEIEELQKEYNVTEIRFQDDCFTINPTRFIDLSDMLAKTGIKYRCSMRVDQVDDETLNRLWESGCREIGFGIESAEDDVLNLLEKGTTVAKNKEALIKTKKRGFRTRAFMMTGLPGETKNSAQKMIDFLEETKPDVVTLTSFIPLPGSDVFLNPEKYGVTILNKNDWKKYSIYLRPNSGEPFVHTINTATLEEMEANREKLKEYLSARGMFNIPQLNKPKLD